MADLSEHPTLAALQRYLNEVCKERGWTKDNYKIGPIPHLPNEDIIDPPMTLLPNGL
jgi:hypothetical protein